MDFYAKLETVKQGLKTEQTILDRNRAKIADLEAQKIMNTKALAVLDRAIEVISANGLGKIETIVSDGLKLVFNEDLRLIIERKEGAKGDSYRLMVQKGETIGPPIDTYGGGVVNVISFLLRIIMIQRFKLSKFLALDEAFNNVSPDNLPRVSEMLRSLCDDHGYTILSITQTPLLASSADRVFTVDRGPLLRELSSDELDDLRSHGSTDQTKGRKGDPRKTKGSDPAASQALRKDSDQAEGV
jgi:DNA repair exonuclease SbcCD ATPase subunit